jgi:hypothetical protein
MNTTGSYGNSCDFGCQPVDISLKAGITVIADKGFGLSKASVWQ